MHFYLKRTGRAKNGYNVSILKESESNNAMFRHNKQKQGCEPRSSLADITA